VLVLTIQHSIAEYLKQKERTMDADNHLRVDTDNHHSVISAAADELREDQLDKVTGGIIAILIGLLAQRRQS
jgi:hypothetical protein